MPRENSIGWQHWYHITLGTYGHWLPGDERGWCEREHRRHVYGTRGRAAARTKWSEGLLGYSKRMLKRAPFRFDKADFAAVASHLFESLRCQGVAVAAVSVGDEHCHLLAQCGDDDPEGCAGQLKNHVYHRMFRGRATPWEKGSHAEPISGLAHGRWVFNYILDHEAEGAWVWGFREREGRLLKGVDWPRPAEGAGL